MLTDFQLVLFCLIVFRMIWCLLTLNNGLEFSTQDLFHVRKRIVVSALLLLMAAIVNFMPVKMLGVFLAYLLEDHIFHCSARLNQIQELSSLSRKIFIQTNFSLRRWWALFLVLGFMGSFIQYEYHYKAIYIHDAVEIARTVNNGVLEQFLLAAHLLTSLLLWLGLYGGVVVSIYYNEVSSMRVPRFIEESLTRETFLLLASCILVMKTLLLEFPCDENIRRICINITGILMFLSIILKCSSQLMIEHWCGIWTRIWMTLIITLPETRLNPLDKSGLEYVLPIVMMNEHPVLTFPVQWDESMLLLLSFAGLFLFYRLISTEMPVRRCLHSLDCLAGLWRIRPVKACLIFLLALHLSCFVCFIGIYYVYKVYADLVTQQVSFRYAEQSIVYELEKLSLLIFFWGLTAALIIVWFRVQEIPIVMCRGFARKSPLKAYSQVDYYLAGLFLLLSCLMHMTYIWS